MPHDSIMPLCLTLSLTAFFTGLLLKSIWLIGVAVLAGLVFSLIWLWPRPQQGQRQEPAL
jgi:hypothetical protein